MVAILGIRVNVLRSHKECRLIEPGQVLAPEIFGCASCLPTVYPSHKITVRPDRRQRGRLAFHQLLVDLENTSPHERQAPAVEQNVMMAPDQIPLILRYSDALHADLRRHGEI